MRGQQREPRLPGLADRGELVAGHDRDYAGRGSGSGQIDCADPGVSVGTSQKGDVGDMGDLGDREIVGIAAVARHETLRLAARQGAADHSGGLGHDCEPHRRSMTASIASTIA